MSKVTTKPLESLTNKGSAQESNNSISTDIRQKITDRIITLMERGVTEWRKTWLSAARNGMPRNPATGTGYKGINVLVLWAEAQDRGYTRNDWLTYKQAAAAGAQVRKGEHGTQIVYFDKLKIEDKVTGEDKLIPMLKAFTVFNIQQIDGLPDKFAAQSTAVNAAFTPVPEAEALIQATGATIKYGYDHAAYAPAADIIIMPDMAQFKTPEAFYATSLHELTHWTGAESRLNRTFGKKFGDDASSVEELTAELGSAFLCGSLGFVDATIEGHASYLASWLKVLKANNTAIFSAASAA